ncbi:MAG: UvrD-helicase domain-containing protein [Candidatus Binataceae bacterium]|nr:UvrD-helicase domain-containing protein [Candidatus Binataceae bacterium]
MSSLDLEKLNPEQRDAVMAPDGPILILAGAGSGKTRVLTHRIAHLLAEGKATPDQMLAVTFTNKAAREMRERVAALVGTGANRIWISTFHSACARILRHEAPRLGFTPDFTIFDEGDSLTLLRRILEEAALPDSPTPEIARARINQAKNEAVSPAHFADAAAGGRDLTLAKIYQLYQDRMRAMNALDFDDLQFLTFHLFEREPEALARWQGRAAHLLVDEYQDTNNVQYQLVRALSARTGNLCVVGDEDQSIYRWRGADIRNILDFERDFPNARIFKLEQNYRSTKTILAAANDVIRNNSERKVKTLWTENGDGDQIVYYTGLTERDEADFIAREVARLTGEARVRPADVVVFYRVNAQSRVIEEALVRRRIPYYIVGGVRFYEHREIKDLLVYLRLIINPADALSLERLVGVPPRGIGARTVEVMREVAADAKIPLYEAMGRLETESRVAFRIAKQASALYEWLRDLIGRAASMSVRSVLDEVIDRSGFAAYLDGLADGPTRKQNVAEMLAAASAFDAESGTGGLADFLERVALVSDADQVNTAGGRIALMTLHTSKGLEYPAVFIAGMEEGLFPHSRAQNSDTEVEEDRRLCYVGMTRARELLYLTNTLSRELYGTRSESRSSRFLNEISTERMRRIAPERERETSLLRPPSRDPYIDYTDSQLPADRESGEFAAGTRVIHPTLGRGVVRKKEGRGDAAKAWINFDRGGIKLLVLKFANLRPIAD